MKKFIFTLAALLSILSSGLAQQIPLSSTYLYNKFLINPALTGIYKRPQMYLVHRSQWTGLPGNPKTSLATVETSLNQDKIGLGAVFFNDELGITSTTGFKLAYAYKLKFNTDAFLSLGLSAGISRLGINFNEAVVKDFDDLSIYNFNAMNRTTFDATGGADFNWRKLHIGFALPNLVNTKARFHKNDSLISTSAYYSYARHFVLMIGDEFKFTEDGKSSLSPTILMKRDLVKGKRPMQFDIGIMYDYMKKYMVGVAYRTDYGVIAQVGVKLFDQLTIGYAYDFHTNKNWKGADLVGQTHEIILGFEFAKEKTDLSKKVKQLDQQVQENTMKVNDLDSTVRDTKKKVEKLNNDLRKRDDDNFQNLKKELDKTNADIEELRKKINEGGGTGTGGGTYTLNRIYFKTDRSDLLPGSLAELDELVEVMNKYPNMNIKIMGHTDSRQGEAYNQKLSERRAKAVYDYLVSKGISKDRLEYEGYGKKLPVADNGIEAGMQLNRRVQIKITKF